MPQLAVAKPVATASTTPPPVEDSPKAPVSSDTLSNDPFAFLNEPSIQRLQKKAKSFIDTLPATVGNLFGPKTGSKKAQPGITTAQIGAKLKGLPPEKKALLGCGGLLALFILCSGLCSTLLTIGKHGNETITSTSQNATSSGYLKTSASMPPQVKKAFVEGKEVWCLDEFECKYGNWPYGGTLYAVFNGNRLERVVAQYNVISVAYPSGLDPSVISDNTAMNPQMGGFFLRRWNQWTADQPSTSSTPTPSDRDYSYVFDSTVGQPIAGSYSETEVWKGKKDGTQIAIHYSRVISDKRDRNQNATLGIKIEMQIVATPDVWQAKSTRTTDIEYTINTESDARSLNGKQGIKYSADMKRATEHVVDTEDAGGRVMGKPDADEMRALRLPD